MRLVIAGDASGDADLREGARLLADAVHEGRLPGDDSPVALRFPPFLRWAIWHSDATTGRVRALQIAARMYRRGGQASCRTTADFGADGGCWCCSAARSLCCTAWLCLCRSLKCSAHLPHEVSPEVEFLTFIRARITCRVFVTRH